MKQADYVINPYRGCQFGCVYCYAQCTGFAQKQASPWGSFVDVKTNALQVLDRELKDKPCGRIMLGSVTEVYQEVEKTCEITRNVLERLVDTGCSVLILTKSDLITRDIDILKKFRDIMVCFTVNTTDNIVIRAFEKKSPPYERRRDAVIALHDAGIPVYIHTGPFLPYLTDPEAIMSDLSEYVQRFDFENLNLKMLPWQTLQEIVRTRFGHLLPQYQAIYSDESSFEEYWVSVRQILTGLGVKYERDTNIYFHPYDIFFPISVR
jgi:DNA repair photolyase